MGVDTKQWGPSAWVVIHAIAQSLDRFGDAAAHFSLWQQLARILPCVFCRNSAGSFVLQAMAPHCSQRRFAFDLHNLVNGKLFLQDLEKMPRAQAMKKWIGYAPASVEAVAAVDVDEREFAMHLFRFLYYAMADFDAARAPFFAGFLQSLSTIARGSQFHAAWQASVQNRPLDTDTLFRRLTYLFDVQQHFYRLRWNCLPDQTLREVFAMVDEASSESSAVITSWSCSRATT